MQIFNFDPETGEYLGSGSADRNPMFNPDTPGDTEFLTPAFSTTTAPPTVAAKQAAVFIGGAWSIAIDRRGEIWFRADRTPVLIEALGDPADVDLLEEQPPEPEQEPPEPGALPPRLVASALNISISSADIASVEGVYGLAGAIYLDTGAYMLLFLNSQPDASYFAVISGGAPCMIVIEKDVDYLIIGATESAGGTPVDPAQFSVQVFRA